MRRARAQIAWAALWLALAAGAARAELYVWVDAEGQTHISDDPKAVPPGAASLPGSGGGAGALWDGQVAGPPARAASRDRSESERRIDLQVRGALDDLRRGETARAAASLEGVVRAEPANPEAHWYLALLDRQRGRLESVERHLEAFLAHAGDARDAWRASAEKRLAALRDERRLSAEQGASGPLRLVATHSPHFRVRYDARLGEASPDYARTVLRYLEEAYRNVVGRLGVAPREPTGVVLYGKAAYLAAHQHRFSFPTVGFFDGSIHVASAAHPAGELRSLLFHEYTHAVFAERSGGDRPFWLNEGLAELAERVSRGEPGVSRSERASLRRRIDAGEWIPLERLAPGFGGLDEASARVAYLEATAAAAWVESHAGAVGIGALLDAIAVGQDFDDALRRATGLTTAELDATLRREIQSEFAAP